MARVFVANPDHGIIENQILDATDVYDVVAALVELSSEFSHAWYQNVSLLRSD